MSDFVCSVVIPSCNRAAKLDLLLAALAAQDTEQPFEVIVVLDGCADNSREVLETWQKAEVFAALRWREQMHQGQAIARNTGSFLARAEVLLFLDDDVLPDPDLIERHLAHHVSSERLVVLGDCEIVRASDRSLAELSMWMWWEDTNHRRAAANQPASYRDFCTGNLSIRRDDFARVGGFDNDFTGYGREDYELGYRLLRSGVRFVADRGARARHFNTSTVRRMGRAARHEAVGDVLIAKKHPELTAGLRLMPTDDLRSKFAGALAMFAPWLGVTLCFALRGLLAVAERFRLRRRWRAGVDFIWTYSYWRGLHDALGSLKAVRALRATAIAPADQEVEVRQPLGPQVSRLNIDVPCTVAILFDGRPIASVRVKPDLNEPFLPWLSTRISEEMTPRLLGEVARAALPGLAAGSALPALLDLR